MVPSSSCLSNNESASNSTSLSQPMASVQVENAEDEITAVLDGEDYDNIFAVASATQATGATSSAAQTILRSALRSVPEPKTNKRSLSSLLVDNESSSDDADGESENGWHPNPKRRRVAFESGGVASHQTSLNDVLRDIARPKIPSCPVYNDGDDLETFISKARVYLNQFPYETDRQKLDLLSMGLNGASRHVFDGFKKDHGDKTVERFFATLRTVIRPRKKPLEELICIKQEADECSSTMGMRMLSVAGRAFPSMSAEELDKTCLTYFKQKISEAAKAHLAHHKPKTFIRAMKLARECEEQRQKSRRAPAVDFLNHVNNSPSPAPRLEKNQTGVQEMAEQLARMKERLDRFEANADPSKRQNDHTRGAYRQHKNANLTCFHCNMKGHSYMNCRNATAVDKLAIQERLSRKNDGTFGSG